MPTDLYSACDALRRPGYSREEAWLDGGPVEAPPCIADPAVCVGDCTLFVDPDQENCRPWYGTAPDMGPFERQ